jgi:hypothetical protein
VLAGCYHTQGLGRAEAHADPVAWVCRCQNGSPAPCANGEGALLSMSAAAERAGVSARTIQRAIARGELTPVRTRTNRGWIKYLFASEMIDGWVPPCDRPRRRYTDFELLEQLVGIERRQGYVTWNDIERRRKAGRSASPRTFVRRFGSIADAASLASGRPTRVHLSRDSPSTPDGSGSALNERARRGLRGQV